MSLSTMRPFAAAHNPSSPAGTTVSSLNYSSYGQPPFASGSRGAPSVASSSYSNPPAIAPRAGSSSRSGQRSGERKLESKEVARTHWRALRHFLASWLKNESPSARASAREKLTRLTKLQFQELSTDVYDELMRRQAAESGSPEDAMPFLPVRDDFHPKRNQARQKLATLPRNRFKDLASDVYHELRRRYPEFEQEEGELDPYEDNSMRNAAPQSAPDRRVGPTPPPNVRLNSSLSHQRSGSRQLSSGSVGTHRSKPSRDYRERERSQVGEDEMEQLDGFDDRPSANLTAATNDVVVPNKSRLREEDIEVPYARDSVMEVPSRGNSRANSRAEYGRNGDRDSRLSNATSASMIERTHTPRNDRDRGPNADVLSPNLTNDDREYYDRMSFSSNVTNKSKLPNGGPVGWDDERERKIRSDYELRIAGLERRVNLAESEREEARRILGEEKERRREYEDELRGLKERATTHSSSLRSVQHELDIARDAAQNARKHADQNVRTAEDDARGWRERCQGLEEEVRRLEDEKAHLERTSGGARGGGAGGSDELRAELQSLVEELNALSMRNDELMAEREADAAGMNEMEEKVEEYKRKYDAVRIELRNLKATSTMFASKPITDDHLPASQDGNIADINVSAFQTAIDTLLSAARSSTPSGVLPAMKAIVEAVTEIGEDVKGFEAHPNLDVDVSRLESLKHDSTTRLNGLMQAARNHAMASGLSPVSLLDAAAGHLSANVVEIIKLLKIRRTMRSRRSSLSIREMVDRDAGKANDAFNREYGREERLRESPNDRRRGVNDNGSRGGSRVNTPVDRLAPSPVPPTGGGGAPPPTLRINSFQSTSSQRVSDSFDLERKASVASSGDRYISRPAVESSSRNGYRDERDRIPSNSSTSRYAPAPAVGGGRGTPYDDRNGNGNMSQSSIHTATSESSVVGPGTAKTSDQERFAPSRGVELEPQGGDEGEWEELKPYLNTQSSLLVNSIQNLLAAIRTGNQSPQLNEHLSEVIAIASSIVAVAGNALPAALRGEGDGLLRDLIGNTNKLSEAQESAKHGGFEKNLRQGIASASFGVAKALKSLMKLGNNE